MGMPAIHHRRWTTAEVRALMDESRHWPRYELIGGELVVTPAPGVIHQMAVTEFLLLIAPYVKQQNLGTTFTSPSDVELKPGTITQPDIFVVPADVLPETDTPPVWADVTRLHLAVEIISPSSIRTYRIEKRDLYMDVGVPEYWIVDLDARIVERWTPARETPDIFRSSLLWQPPAAQNVLTIDLDALFDRIWANYRPIRRL